MLRLLRRAGGLLLLAAVLAAAPQAQDAPAQEITFDEALRLGLQRNPQLLQATNATEARDLAVTQARSIFLPDLTASVRPVQRYGLVFDQTTGRLDQETSESLDASVSTNLNLFNGFGDVAALRRAQLQSEAGEYALERARQDVLFNVASTFLQIILDKELVQIQTETLAAEQAQLERIEELVEAGVRPRADAFQQAAVVAERELQLLQAESQLEVSQTQLVQILQLDPFERYTFVAPSLESVPLTPQGYDLEVLLTAALERREDLKAQALEIEAAEESIRVARSGYWPAVNLFASFGSSYSSLAARPIPGTGAEIPVTTASGDPIFIGGQPFTIGTGPDLEDTPFTDQFFTDNRGGSIGIAVNIPIFDRFATRAEVQRAQLSLANERIALAELEQQVALQVRQSYLEYLNASKRLDVTERQVAAAEVALNAEQERYDLGASTLTELTQARARLIEAQSARAQAVAQFVFQSKLLEYAVGTLDPTARLFE